MIATENEEVLRIFDFVCKKQANRLQRLFATVNVIAEKEVIGFWRKAAVFEQTKEVVILSMDITADLMQAHTRLAPSTVLSQSSKTCLDGRLKFKKNWLRDENFTGLGAKVADLGFQ